MGSHEPRRNLTRGGGSVEFVRHAVLNLDPTLPGNDVTNVFGALGKPRPTGVLNREDPHAGRTRS